MIEYINENQAGFWVAVGFILLAAEVLVFGFGTIVFLFAGIGAILTGLLMMSGLLPQTWIVGISCFGIGTGIVSAALWTPLRKMQDNSEPQKQLSSDLIGYRFVLEQDIAPMSAGKHRYSGVDWQVKLEEGDEATLVTGQKVVVSSVDVGIFYVKAVQ